MKRLENKVAIVTGSSGGIGKVTALEFAKEGCKVVVHYNTREDEAMKIVDEIKKLGSDAIAVQIDFSKKSALEKQIKSVVEKTVKKFGRIDILVNLAGYIVKDLWNKPALEYTEKEFYDPIDVDTYGTFLFCKAVAPQMLKQKIGNIIITSSTPAIVGHNRGFGFTVAKSANIGIMKGLVLELSPYVRVNTIALGNIETGWEKYLSKEEYEKAKMESPLQRFGKPEEVAKTLVYLASDDSSFVNGQIIVVDGGTVIR